MNGVRIDADSALSVMRKACEYLNIGRSGGRAALSKPRRRLRNVSHVKFHLCVSQRSMNG